VPALSAGERKIQPLRVRVYYMAAGRDPAAIKPFPRGLRLVAGNAAATSQSDNPEAYWFCGNGGTPQSIPTIACRRGENLNARILFPECSDGRPDSSDHQSHMAPAVWSGRGPRCPKSHPIAVPQISLTVTYPAPPPWPTELASGSMLSFHADFFEAWRPGALRGLIESCIRGSLRSCRARP
jgi:hypothetical protein